MDESFRLNEYQKLLYRFLDLMLLNTIDKEVFFARDAAIEVVDVGYDVSTYGNTKAAHERIMFTDAISLAEIFDHPTGETHKTYESGRGMAATTHGDIVLAEAQDWCDAWWEDYTSDTMLDRDDLWEICGEAGLTTPHDWYSQLTGTLGELRARCGD